MLSYQMQPMPPIGPGSKGLLNRGLGQISENGYDLILPVLSQKSMQSPSPWACLHLAKATTLPLFDKKISPNPIGREKDHNAVARLAALYTM